MTSHTYNVRNETGGRQYFYDNLRNVIKIVFERDGKRIGENEYKYVFHEVGNCIKKHQLKIVCQL